MNLGDVAIVLLMAALATTGRVFLTIALSIVTGWLLGYLALKSRAFEGAYVSISGVLESVPVISFFPVVLVFFIRYVRGYLGVELAVDFLVFTAVVWNIWMGIYQAFKTVPLPMLEVAENLRYGFFSKMRRLYIPFSIPRIAANLIPSFADAFFYITVSEVVTIGTTSYKVFGIGSELAALTSELESNPSAMSEVVVGLAELAAVVVVVTLGLRRFANWAAARYALDSPLVPSRRGGRRRTWRTLSRYYVPLERRFGALARRGGAAVATGLQTIVALRPRLRPLERQRAAGRPLADLVVKAVGVAILLILLYGAAKVVVSTSYGTWEYLLSSTPAILEGLAYDYARVFVIAAVSFIFAIFVGYAMAFHRRVEGALMPLLQAYSAFPAPAYFPLLFAATYALTYRLFGGLGNEVYVMFLGFISTFYYVLYSYWMGLKALPVEVVELVRNLRMGFFRALFKIYIPSTLPYIVTGLTSTIDSAWGGLMIGEYWPSIYGSHNLEVTHGVLKILDVATAQGNIALASWASFIFAMFVVAFAMGFTRHLMDLSRRKYVIEESVFAA